MTEAREAVFRYWRTALADGALGEGKFTQANRKRFVDVPAEALKSGVLPVEVIERVFRGQASAKAMGIRFWPLVMARNCSVGAEGGRDIRIRGMGEKAQQAHIRAVKDLATFLCRSPDTAISEELRAYQLHMTEAGVTCRPSTPASWRCGSSSA
jgi:hypothetical protein